MFTESVYVTYSYLNSWLRIKKIMYSFGRLVYFFCQYCTHITLHLYHLQQLKPFFPINFCYNWISCFSCV